MCEDYAIEFVIPEFAETWLHISTNLPAGFHITDMLPIEPLLVNKLQQSTNSTEGLGSVLLAPMRSPN